MQLTRFKFLTTESAHVVQLAMKHSVSDVFTRSCNGLLQMMLLSMTLTSLSPTTLVA